MANQHNVGIAEMVLSSAVGDVLVAPNLGSCLGIAVYDPKRQQGALVHCLLPISTSDPEKAKKHPYMYVDTAAASMLTQLFQRGTNKHDLQIVAAGGSQINDVNGLFNIGKKNHTVFRKFMWKNDLLIAAEHIGGNVSRTFSLHIATGEVWVKVSGENIRLK